MKFEATPIAGLWRIEIEPHADARGFFARTYCIDEFARAGVRFGSIRQSSLSFNRVRGTLRGLHWQAAPKLEGKLVRPARGRIFDVIVDLRANSPTFCRWFGAELRSDRSEAFLVPPLCAHGFVTLEDDSVVDYAMDADFDTELARGVRWDDPAFGIVWPIEPVVMSDRDRTYPDFQR